MTPEALRYFPTTPPCQRSTKGIEKIAAAVYPKLQDKNASTQISSSGYMSGAVKQNPGPTAGTPKDLPSSENTHPWGTTIVEDMAKSDFDYWEVGLLVLYQKSKSKVGIREQLSARHVTRVRVHPAALIYARP